MLKGDGLHAVGDEHVSRGKSARETFNNLILLCTEDTLIARMYHDSPTLIFWPENFHRTVNFMCTRTSNNATV